MLEQGTLFGECRAAKRKIPDDIHHRFIARFCEEWRRRYNASYPFSALRGKNSAAVKAILDTVGRDMDGRRMAAKIIRLYLDDEDPYLIQAGHDLALLRFRLARYIAMAAQ